MPDQELPEWDVTTHGPLPDRLSGRYRPVGGQSVYPVPTATGPAVPASPDGAHVGTRVVEGPPEAGAGGAEQQASAQVPGDSGQTALGTATGPAITAGTPQNGPAGKHEGDA